MTVFVSSLVLVLIALGLRFRRQRRVHIPLMISAFALDLGLVLWIELNRQAVEQALAGVQGLLLFHILVSLLVLVLYAALIASGLGWLKARPWGIAWHRRLALAFIVCRLTNFVTSLFL